MLELFTEAIHATLITKLTSAQSLIFKRNSSRVSCIVIVSWGSRAYGRRKKHQTSTLLPAVELVPTRAKTFKSAAGRIFIVPLRVRT